MPSHGPTWLPNTPQVIVLSVRCLFTAKSNRPQTAHDVVIARTPDMSGVAKIQLSSSFGLSSCPHSAHGSNQFYSNFEMSTIPTLLLFLLLHLLPVFPCLLMLLSLFVLPMILLVPPSPLLLDPTFLMLSLLPLTVSSLSLTCGHSSTPLVFGSD
jgi:hypothetical protein